ncbi:GDYXXLXY domain-containing protein [Moraxella sp. ZJ142]|uniref:GDYXXLXY domain-containing protein n=1 Tax=Moraxella marmotae TaxID=3344520 RepID=UPI0035D4B5EB
MRKLSKRLPIILTLVSLGVMAVMVINYERHLATGRVVYAPLGVSDPRSWLQGDYMALNYQLNADKATTGTTAKYRLGYALLDNRSIIRRITWQPVDKAVPIVLNGTQGDWQLPPDGWLFAEGLGECYAQAKFAKLSLDDDGQVLLIDLVGDDLQDLHCQDKTSWWQGGIPSSNP